MKFRFLPNLILLVLSVFLFFAVGEIVTRISGVYDAEDAIRNQAGTFYKFNPSFSIAQIEHIPNKEGKMYGAYVMINSLGYRDKEYNTQKPEGTFRILVFGDSNTFGLGVNQGETYSDQIELLLNKNSSREYEVWNLGRIGHNTLQELELLKRWGLGYEPDLIILGYHHADPECPYDGCGEELQRATFDAFDGPYGIPLDYNWKERQIVKWRFLRWLAQKYEEALWTLGLETPYTEATIRLHDPKSLTWKSTQAAFKGFSKISQEQGIPILFLIFPEADYLPLDPYPFQGIHEQELNEAEQNGFHVIDIYDVFKPYDIDMLKIRPDDGHPSPFAHRLVAEAIYSKLSSIF